MERVRIGNIYGEDRGTGFAGNVWDKKYLSPTITTMMGGCREPMIIDEGILDSSIKEKTSGEQELPWEVGRKDGADVRTEQGTDMQHDKHGNEGQLCIRANNKKGFYEYMVGGVLDIGYPTSKNRRGRVERLGQVSPTVTTSPTLGIIEYDERW